MTTFSDNQLLLQSFLDSDLIAAWQKDFASNIAYAKNPSVKQVEWIDKIVNGVLNTPEVVSSDRYKNIFDMFETAKGHLKWPRVHMEFTSNDGKKFGTKFSVAGENSKAPGSITIVIGPLGYVGRLDKKSGSLILNAQAGVYVKDITDFCDLFTKDPVNLSIQQGKAHSRCCYCGMDLKTQESLAVGYGPDCAKHWGLPWGTDKKTDSTILKDKI